MTTIIAQIDWISYTGSNEQPVLNGASPWPELSRQAVVDVLGFIDPSNELEQDWRPMRPQMPYRFAVQEANCLARIDWGRAGEGYLVSLPGTTCRRIREVGQLGMVLGTKTGAITRVDIACDMETKTTPTEFVKKRTHKKFQTTSFFDSPDGQTAYVGSWKSDRFARVYRYAEPHPRASLLRAEHVFRGRQAKQVAAQLLTVTPGALTRALGEIWGWGHADWEPETARQVMSKDITAQAPERHASNTLQWLEQSVMSTIYRLWTEGEIGEPIQWFTEAFEAHLQARQSRDTLNSDA